MRLFPESCVSKDLRTDVFASHLTPPCQEVSRVNVAFKGLVKRSECEGEDEEAGDGRGVEGGEHAGARRKEGGGREGEGGGEEGGGGGGVEAAEGGVAG